MTTITEHQHQMFTEELHTLRYNLLEDILACMDENGDERVPDLQALLDENEDYSVANQLVDLNLPYLERETQQLQAVQKAEKRLQEGHYGLCVDCGREINLDRLYLQPAASRCIECQESYERVHGSGEFSH